MEGDRAAGVAYTQDGITRTENARHVISDIGAANTAKLLPARIAPAWRDALRSLAPGLGFVARYIGLEGDLHGADVSSASHWIYESADVRRLWRKPADDDAPGLFVSFPSLKDPKWRGPPAAKADYTAFKQPVASRLLAQFGRHFPALAPMVRFHDAATPRTQQRFTRPWAARCTASR